VLSRNKGTEVASALAEARERLEVKIREVQRLQQSLDAVRRDVQKRETSREPSEIGHGMRPA